MPLNFLRGGFFWIFASIFALRLAVGFHFYMEGTSKLKEGKFSAVPFLNAARGPLAKQFQSILEDPDGKKLLCVTAVEVNGKTKLDVDPSLTFSIWDDFADRAFYYYEFGDSKIVADIERRIAANKKKIQAAQSDNQLAIDIDALKLACKTDQDSITAVLGQYKSLEATLEHHQNELKSWLEQNRTELLAYYSTNERIDGFDRDGDSRHPVATEVESLRKQVDSIRSDRQRQVSGWRSQVLAIWDSFEGQVNRLAVDRQASKSPLVIHRPFDQPQSKIKWINRAIPWFDTIVGVLLMVGLFSRLAALGGAVFLASIIATQPPWIEGTVATYYQIVEMMALIFLTAVASGRFAGLDYFLQRKSATATSMPPN